jgi:transcriptional regulator with XRE-family HTH domain
MSTVTTVTTHAAAPAIEEPPTLTTGWAAGLLRTAEILRTGLPPAANDDFIASDVAALDGTPLVPPKPKRSRGMRSLPDDIDCHKQAAENRRIAELIGSRLLEVRRMNGWTQTEAAAMLGWATPAQLAQIEAGQRRPPHDALLHIATVYNCSLDFIFGLIDSPDRDPARRTRATCLASVRGMLERVAELTVEQVDRSARLSSGMDVGTVRELLFAASRALDSLQLFQKLNQKTFDDLRGGASLIRAEADLGDAVRAAKSRLKLSDALDADLPRPEDDEA